MSNHSSTLKEISTNILNSLRGGRSSHSEHYSLEQIKFQVKYYRSLLIRRDQERNFNRYNQFEQDLGLVEVDLQDTSENTTIPSNKLLLRTAKKIPEPIRLKQKEAITFVGCINKFGKPFPLIDPQRSYWRQFDKYTSNETDIFYKGGYIWVREAEDIEHINIRGIFEDPEEVHEFTRANGLDLYDDNSPFPVPADMIQQITQAIINTEGKTLVQTPNDEELDNVQDSNKNG